MVALRRFRLAFADDYRGKSEAEIHDRLHVALAEHEECAKGWGLELTDRTFTFLSSKEGILSSALGALTVASVGGAVALPIGGAAVVLGKVGLEFLKVRREQRLAELKSDVAYLSKLLALEN